MFKFGSTVQVWNHITTEKNKYQKSMKLMKDINEIDGTFNLEECILNQIRVEQNHGKANRISRKYLEKTNIKDVISRTHPT